MVVIADWSPLRIGYIVLFGLTALACFGAIHRARIRIEDQDTRWGLTTLLLTSGLWAAFHVGRLAAPLAELKIAFYMLGLTAGLAAVGAWLYFCSAYVGEHYHRQSRYRWLALTVYVLIITVKLTNPIHGLYFTTTTAQEPFVHLVITLGAFHWIVTGLTYSLSAIGFYMLFDLFDDSTYATTRLAILVSLAALPVVFDLIGYLSPDVIITLNYEPIGVALFAVGVLYVADGSFLAVQIFGREQLLDELEEAIVLLDSDGVIRDVNDTARWLFPALTEGVGCAATTVIPEITNYLPVDDPRVITVEEGDAARYYLLSAPELTVGRTTIGRALVLTDVTEVERQRREVERQRDQLDDFAAAITHELRNTVNILQGHLQQVETGLTPDTDPRTVESITTAVETTDRMTDIVGDLATLAQFGHRPKETTAIDVASVAREAWATLGVETAELTVSAEPTIEADPARLERLFVNLFEFMVQNGATEIELGYSNGTIVVTDDGRPLTAGNVERAFAYGEAVPDAEVGMLLPVVRTLADTHGWETTIDPEYQAGVRFQIVQ